MRVRWRARLRKEVLPALGARDPADSSLDAGSREAGRLPPALSPRSLPQTRYQTADMGKTWNCS